jgi:hypothetical protein
MQILDVGRSLCKRGRGENTVKCRFYDDCAFQQQKKITANIWFAAHECAAHKKPGVLGNIGWVIFDEDLLDAVVFGLDSNKPVTLELDALKTPLKIPAGKLGFSGLEGARRALYRALDYSQADMAAAGAATRAQLRPFIDKASPLFGLYRAGDMRRLTLRGKVEPSLLPDMTSEEIDEKLAETAGNPQIKKETVLWELIEAIGDIETYGRIRVRHDTEGRKVHMVGKAALAEGWRDVPVLICDATGDAELLKAMWPTLRQAEPAGWQQLPRPSNVRIVQCVDRALSKCMVAIEGKNKERCERAARRLYAAMLMKALGYGGADVGVIT